MNTRPKNWNPNNTNNPMRTCAKCGKDFKREHNRQTYCLECKAPVVKAPKDPNRFIVKKCENCRERYKATSPAQKYCPECVPIMKSKRQKLYKESHKKGYDQKGESNNNWKGGIGIYPELANDYGLPNHCERCGSTSNLLVHHKDEDRYNNEKENLERLCKSCHQRHHKAGINLHPNSPVFKSNKV